MRLKALVLATVAFLSVAIPRSHAQGVVWTDPYGRPIATSTGATVVIALPQQLNVATSTTAPFYSSTTMSGLMPNQCVTTDSLGNLTTTGFQCIPSPVPVTLGSVSFWNSNTMLYAPSSFHGPFTTATNGVDEAIFACVAFDGAPNLNIASVIYGGLAMSPAGPAVQNPTGNEYVRAFWMVNPPPGLNQLVINTFGPVRDIYADLTTFIGVNQTTPVRAGSYTTSSTTSGGVSLVIPSDPNDLTFSCINGGTGGAIVGTNQTLDGKNNLGTYQGESDHATMPAASVTHNWTGGGNEAALGFSIQHD